MKNKVVFLSYIDFYDSTAGAARVKMYSKMLQSAGVETEYYSIHDFYNINNSAKKLRSNKFIFRLSYPFRVLIYVLSLAKFLKSEYNIVFYLYPTTNLLLDYVLIIYLKFFKNEKIFLEVNEIRKWGAAVKLNSFRYFICFQYEFLSRYFDGLVCISKNIAVYYKKYNSNILRIPILSDQDSSYIDNSSYKEGAFNIGFTGSVHIEKENLKIFFSALNIIANNGYDIVFNMYGSISNEKYFYQLVSFYKLDNIVKYHGIVEQNLIPSILAMQDLLVLPRAATLQNIYGFSTKLSEYLVSGVPVLITDVSDNLIYLTSGEDCLVADFERPESFAKQIEMLITNYNVMAEKLAKNAFLVAKKSFHYGVYSNSYREFLQLS